MLTFTCDKCKESFTRIYFIDRGKTMLCREDMPMDILQVYDEAQAESTRWKQTPHGKKLLREAGIIT